MHYHSLLIGLPIGENYHTPCNHKHRTVSAAQECARKRNGSWNTLIGYRESWMECDKKGRFCRDK